MALTIDQKIEVAWPGVSRKQVLVIGPLGSRDDYLLFNRLTQEVTTGNVGNTRTCWFSTLDAFAERVETSYGERLQSHQYSEEGRASLVRYRAEYRRIIQLLRELPEYVAVEDVPVAYA